MEGMGKVEEGWVEEERREKVEMELGEFVEKNSKWFEWNGQDGY